MGTVWLGYAYVIWDITIESMFGGGLGGEGRDVLLQDLPLFPDIHFFLMSLLVPDHLEILYLSVYEGCIARYNNRIYLLATLSSASLLISSSLSLSFYSLRQVA